jgi:hypothetical protein
LWRGGRLLAVKVTLAEMTPTVPQSVVDAIIKDVRDGKVDGDWSPAEIESALEYLRTNPDYQRAPLDPSKKVTLRPGQTAWVELVRGHHMRTFLVGIAAGPLAS